MLKKSLFTLHKRLFLVSIFIPDDGATSLHLALTIKVLLILLLLFLLISLLVKLSIHNFAKSLHREAEGCSRNELGDDEEWGDARNTGRGSRQRGLR